MSNGQPLQCRLFYPLAQESAIVILACLRAGQNLAPTSINAPAGSQRPPFPRVPSTNERENDNEILGDPQVAQNDMN